MRQPGPPNVLFVVASAAVSASTTVRVHQYIPKLEGLGFRVTELPYRSAAREAWHGRLITGHRRLRSALTRNVVRAILLAWREVYAGVRNMQILMLASKVDIVFIQKVLLPPWLVDRLVRAGTRVAYDFDDAVFLQAPRRTTAVVSRAWRVVAGSHFNLEFARQHNPRSGLVPSAVPVECYRGVAKAARSASSVRVGWIGSPWTMRYLERVAEPLRRLAARGMPVTLVIVGSGNRPDLMPNFGSIPLHVVPTYTGVELPGLVAQIDIGLMPLEDGPWERGKCAMKALVYMAGGCPAICSPVGEVMHIIEHGVSGYFADSVDEWEAALIRLVSDPQLRWTIGQRGREVVESRYSTEVCFKLLQDMVFGPLLTENADRGES